MSPWQQSQRPLWAREEHLRRLWPRLSKPEVLRNVLQRLSQQRHLLQRKHQQSSQVRLRGNQDSGKTGDQVSRRKWSARGEQVQYESPSRHVRQKIIWKSQPKFKDSESTTEVEFQWQKVEIIAHQGVGRGKTQKPVPIKQQSRATNSKQRYQVKKLSPCLS